MSEYTEVEQPFLQQLREQGWEIIDQGGEIPSDPGRSRRASFRQWLLPEVFTRAVAAITPGAKGGTWLTEKQLLDLQEQLLRQPNRTLLEANEAVRFASTSISITGRAPMFQPDLLSVCRTLLEMMCHPRLESREYANFQG